MQFPQTQNWFETSVQSQLQKLKSQKQEQDEVLFNRNVKIRSLDAEAHAKAEELGRLMNKQQSLQNDLLGWENQIQQSVGSLGQLQVV